MSKGNAYAAHVAALPDDEFADLVVAVNERLCRDRYGFGTFAEAAALYRPSPPCPSCGSGLRRYRCRRCGARFNSLTGTVLEHCRKELSTWVGFVNLMRFNVPLDAAAKMCRVTHQTACEWRHRIFATVDGCQGHIVLRDRWYMALTAPTSLPRKTGAKMRATLCLASRLLASRMQSRIRCTTQRCQAAPWKTSPVARLKPPWASEVTSYTPSTPRAAPSGAAQREDIC